MAEQEQKFNEIYNDILSKDKVYLDLVGHSEELAANELTANNVILKEIVRTVFDPGYFYSYSVEQRRIYLHYRLFFYLCAEKVIKSFKNFSFIDNEYHPGEKMIFIDIVSGSKYYSYSPFNSIPIIFNYTNPDLDSDMIILHIEPVSLEDGQWRNDFWLGWPAIIKIKSPGDLTYRDLGRYTIGNITKGFIVDLIQ